MKKVNLQEKFDQFQEHWTPKIVGEINDQHVKLAKLKGEFVMHQHEHEDEMFYVVNGNLKMEFEDRTETIKEGEFIIVPKGVMHKPVAEEEVLVMLIEPKSTLNTGNVDSDLTQKNLERL